MFPSAVKCVFPASCTSMFALHFNMKLTDSRLSSSVVELWTIFLAASWIYFAVTEWNCDCECGPGTLGIVIGLIAWQMFLTRFDYYLRRWVRHGRLVATGFLRFYIFLFILCFLFCAFSFFLRFLTVCFVLCLRINTLCIQFTRIQIHSLCSLCTCRSFFILNGFLFVNCWLVLPSPRLGDADFVISAASSSPATTSPYVDYNRLTG